MQTHTKTSKKLQCSTVPSSDDAIFAAIEPPPYGTGHAVRPTSSLVAVFMHWLGTVDWRFHLYFLDGCCILIQIISSVNVQNLQNVLHTRIISDNSCVKC